MSVHIPGRESSRNSKLEAVPMWFIAIDVVLVLVLVI